MRPGHPSNWRVRLRAMGHDVVVIGGGLAGCEAAWQLAERGLTVRLVEMKPERRPAAHCGNSLAELVCSNSLRSNNVLNAVGLLKEEMSRLDSLIIKTAHACRVPAGDALAVERELFAEQITGTIEGHDNITRVAAVEERLPADDAAPHIIATGPLTADELASDIAALTGQERLYFYDSLAPIIDAESVDLDFAFAASRYGKGEGSDYLNCPLDRDAYVAFIAALRSAEYQALHDCEDAKYFEGCLPIEVLAARGEETLRFGAMKPVGLTDPRTERRPWAVLQLRKEDKEGQAFNLVGFQTKMKQPEQRRIFGMIPALANASFLRYGAIHRNTYLDSPELLDSRGRLKIRPNIRFAGQITGVEGYVESAAHGLMTARLLAADIRGDILEPPPRTTALGALWQHVGGQHRISGRAHEPQNVNWALFPSLEPGIRKKEKKPLRVKRARAALAEWGEAHGVALGAEGPAVVPR